MLTDFKNTLPSESAVNVIVIIKQLHRILNMSLNCRVMYLAPLADSGQYIKFFYYFLELLYSKLAFINMQFSQ